MFTPVLALSGASAFADSFTLREALADAEQNEGFRAVLTGIEAPTDFSGAALTVFPFDFSLGPIRFDPGCQWWDLLCEWGFDAPPAPGTTNVMDTYAGLVPTKTPISVGSTTPLAMSFTVVDPYSEDLVRLVNYVTVGDSRSPDLWSEVYCVNGVCTDEDSEVLGTYGSDRAIALQVRAIAGRKNNLRVEVRSARSSNPSGTQGAFELPFVGGVFVTSGDIASDGVELPYQRTRIETIADPAAAAILKGEVGIRQGEVPVEYEVRLEDGTVVAGAAGTLEVDIRDLVLRRGRINLDETDGTSFTYAIAASDPTDLYGMDVTLALVAEGATDHPIETITLIHENIRRRLGAPVPIGGVTPGTPVTVRVTELGADGAPTGPTSSCELTYAAGASCEVADLTVKIGKESDEEDGPVVMVHVETAAPGDQDGDGAPDAPSPGVQVSLESPSGTTTANNKQDSFVFGQTSYFSKLPPSVIGSVPLPYQLAFSATLFGQDGQTRGVLTQTFDRVEQFGEILIDGVVWELE